MALLTGLLLMAAISLLAVTAAGGMTLQRQQAVNQEDKARASDRAALAQSHALAWLSARGDTEREAGCEQSCLLPVGVLRNDQLPDDAVFETGAWWRANATAAGSVPVSGEPAGFASGVDPEALWLIEEIHFQPWTGTETGLSINGIGYYRVLARGQGHHPRTVAVSESIVARPWGGEYQPAAYPPDSHPAAFCAQFDPALPCGRLAWRNLR